MLPLNESNSTEFGRRFSQQIPKNIFISINIPLILITLQTAINKIQPLPHSLFYY